MSESNEPTPWPSELVSTPGTDVLMPSTDFDPALPAVSSERKLARRENWRLIRRRPAFIIGNLILWTWVVCAVLGKRITPHDPLDFRATPHLSPRSGYPFGTDQTGRDVLSRVMAGARDVLLVAPAAAMIGVVLGVIIGMAMGYLGGWLDNVLGRIVEAFLALPVVLIALLAITTLGNSTKVVIGVVAVLFTPVVARTVRSAVLAERDLDYVTSARLRGETKFFVMFREVLPNVSGPIIVELTVRIGYAVFTVATLSFLGAGPPPPSPDWGAQVSEGYRVISAGIWWTTFFPALAIASLVIAVSLIADSVQSVLEGS
jgi:peptide/nickel transport system permease protein